MTAQRAVEETLKHARKFKLCLVVALFAATAFAESSLAQQKLPSDWNKVVEAAKREGVVKCACPRRDFALAFKKDFEDAYPGITLETTAATLPEFPLRVAKEQTAKMFLWDVYTFGPGCRDF